jgi:streptomycin 6-kinase
VIAVPDALAWWAARPGGAEWLGRLPAIAAECADRWSLRLGDPFEGGHVSLTVPAERADGSHAVLKINFPEDETEHEADALAFWQGDGAVRLLEQDRERSALLVERCEPGTQLWEVPDDDEATRIAAGVLGRLWRPAPAEHPFRLLADEAVRWADELPADWQSLGRPFERQLVDEAVDFIRAAGADQGEQVVLHQDFHGGNVLCSRRNGWLAIDPKPLVGEREFDAASLLRDRRWLLDESGFPARIRRRLAVLETALDLDRARLRGWGIAHALAWGLDDSTGTFMPEMVECARLLLRS